MTAVFGLDRATSWAWAERIRKISGSERLANPESPRRRNSRRGSGPGHRDVGDITLILRPKQLHHAVPRRIDVLRHRLAGGARVVGPDGADDLVVEHRVGVLLEGEDVEPVD